MYNEANAAKEREENGLTSRIWITSTKGGVGKSTLCANLARAYAAMGVRTLAVDLDEQNRCLDMLFGVENAALYDAGDVLCGRVSIDRAAIALPQSSNLFLLAGGELRASASSMDALFAQAERELGVSVIIIDSHTPSPSLQAALIPSITDTIIVSDDTALSLRAAEACGWQLRKAGAPCPRLVLSRIDFKEESRPSFVEMIDLASLQLLGIIPYDKAVLRMQEKGVTAKEAAHPNTHAAFRNIALRLAGKHAPLFTAFKGIDRKRLLGV